MCMWRVRPGCQELRWRHIHMMHPHVYIVSLHALNGSNKRIVSENPKKKLHLIIVQDANNVITLTGEWLCRSTCLSHAFTGIAKVTRD